jgi:hypothetical protein
VKTRFYDKDLKEEQPYTYDTAHVDMTVLDYITAELFEMAGEGAKPGKQNAIKPKHLLHVLNSLPKLDQLFKDVKF